MRMKPMLCVAAVVAVVMTGLTVSSVVHGEAISLNFVQTPTDGVTPDPAILEPEEVAGFFPSDNWNNPVLPQGGGAAFLAVNDLVDNNGVTTTADFVYTTTKSHGMFSSSENGPPYVPSDKKIFRRYLHQYGDGDGLGGVDDYVSDYTITNLPASVTANGYDVIVYVSSNASPDPRIGAYMMDEGFDTTIDQTIYVWDGANPWTGTYVDGGYASEADAIAAANDPLITEGNYIRFDDLTADSFMLILDALPLEGGADRAAINGIQIVGNGTVPDGACGDINHPYPSADFNLDCYVEWADFGFFASQWQNCTDPAPPCNYNPFE